MQIFSLVGSMLLNDNGVANKLREIGSIGEKLGNTMSGVKEAFGAVGLAAAGYLASAVNSSTKFQQITADLQQTIKSTGGAAGYTADQIKAMAGALSQQTAFSTSEILKGQNMLLTFTNISGKVYKDASMAMLDMSQKMGTEPQQVAIQLGKALNNPVQGITALTRVGVTFTDQQKQQIAAMMAAKDTAGAQEVIIKELNKEFGGQAAAQLNTYAGRMKLLSNNLGSMKVAIGNALLPYLQKFMEIVNKTLAPLISFVKAHGQLTAAVLGAVAAIGTLTGGLTVFHKVAEILGPTISGIISGIAGLSAPIVIAIASVGALYIAYQKNFGGIRDFLNGVFSKVSSAFKVFQDNLKKGMSVPQALADAIGKAFGPKLGQQASTVFRTIQNVISESFKEIQKVWNEVLKPTLDFLLKALQDVIKWVSDNWDTISKVIGDVFKEIQSIYNSILKPILDILLKAMQDIVKWVSDNWGTISKVIETVFSAIKAAWENILKPVLDFLIQTFGQVLKWIDDNWPLISQTIGTVMNAIKDVIETVMNIIKPGWEAAWNIIKNVVPPIWDAIKTIISTAIKVVEDVIKLAMDLITGNWGNAWKDVVNLVKNIFSGAVNIIKDVLNTIDGVFKGIATTALKWGSDMIDGIIKGIKSKINDVGNAASDVASVIKSFLHFSVPDQGPLTDYESWMPDFMEGLAKGIDGNIDVVNNSLIKLSSALANAVMPERTTRADMFSSLAKGTETFDTAIQKLTASNDKLGISTGNSETDLRNMLGQMTNLSTMATIASEEYKKLGKSIGWTDSKTLDALKNYQDYQKQYLETAQKVADAEQKIKDNQYDEAYEKIDADVKKLTADNNDLSEKLNNQYDALDELQLKGMDLDTQYKELVATYGQFSDQAKDAQKAIDDNNQSIRDLGQSIEDTKDKMESAAESDLNNLFDKLKSALKDYYDDEEKEDEAYWQAKIDSNSKWKEDTLSNLESVYNAEKESLEKQKTLLDRQNSDEDDADKIAADKKIINMNYSAKAKADAQADLNSILKEQNRRHQSEQLDDQETSLENQYNADKANIEKVAQANEDYYNSQIDSIKAFYEDKEKVANLDAEAQQMIVQNNQTEIVKLLKSYGEDYEMTGASLGERLVNGFKNQMNSIEDIFEGITAQANSIIDKVTSTSNVVNAAYDGGYGGSYNGNSGFGTMQQTSVSNTYGAFLHADTIVLKNDKDIQQTAEELAFYTQQALRSKGGK